MWPDRVSNPGPLTYESGALPTTLCGPAYSKLSLTSKYLGTNAVDVKEVHCTKDNNFINFVQYLQFGTLN